MQSGDKSKLVKTGTATSKMTRLPHKCPNYVIAFALKETYDDLITAQQMICNKKSPQDRSPQESINSITPTNSLKMFEAEQILNKPKLGGTDENCKNNPCDTNSSIESMTPTNSLKYLSNDDISDSLSLATIGRHENIVINLSGDDDENIKNTSTIPEHNNENIVEIKNNTFLGKSCKPNDVENSLTNLTEMLLLKTELSEEATIISNKLVVENITEKYKNGKDCTKIEPEALFTAIRSNRKLKNRKIPKHKPKKVVNIKSKNFKYNNSKKVIDDRLEKYYKKRHLIHTDLLQKELYSDEVSTVLPRRRVHKIVARENLIEETEFTSFINDMRLNEYENKSVASSLSTVQKSIISIESQNTLTQKDSNISLTNKDDLDDIKAVHSMINVQAENNPYKTDVINVAVAVAYNRSKPNTKAEIKDAVSSDKFKHLGSLTSSEMPSLIPPLTSNSPSKFGDFKAVTIEVSNGTLVNKKSSFEISSDDFVIARTSSDFTKTSDDSNLTLRKNSNVVVDMEIEAANLKNDHEPSLLQTVINLGVYPDITPSTSSDTPYEYDCNDVIITKNITNKYQMNSNKGDSNKQNISKNILKKSINMHNEKVVSKIINLPNQDEIKAAIKNNGDIQMKCAEESRHPSYMPEMWDRLIMSLDMAVRKLEQSMIEKIVEELKKHLVTTIIPKNIPSQSTYRHSDNDIKKEPVHEVKLDIHQGLQCDLVKNTIIDQIMQKLSNESPKIFEPGVAMKTVNKLKLFKDFEVLKSPGISQVLTDKGDAVTVSTITYEVCKFRRLKMLFTGPANFIRENVFVITSVPTFFMVLLCVYGMILLIMKPW